MSSQVAVSYLKDALQAAQMFGDWRDPYWLSEWEYPTAEEARAAHPHKVAMAVSGPDHCRSDIHILRFGRVVVRVESMKPKMQRLRLAIVREFYGKTR